MYNKMNPIDPGEEQPILDIYDPLLFLACVSRLLDRSIPKGSERMGEKGMNATAYSITETREQPCVTCHFHI